MRAGVMADYGPMDDLDDIIRPFGPAFDIPPSAVIFAALGPRDPGFVPPVTLPPAAPAVAPRGIDPRLIPPVNIRAARLRSVFGLAGGIWMVCGYAEGG